MSLYIDVTEFITSLRKTGIERITGELCKHLPSHSAIPIRFDSGRYIALPDNLIPAIGEYFRSSSGSSAPGVLKASVEVTGPPFKVNPSDVILVPELFGSPRDTFISGLSDDELRQFRFIVYDLLPLTHPEYFSTEMPAALFGYFRTIRRAGHCCGFISEYTREMYYSRLKRSSNHDGKILPLGSDSLGPRGREPALNRPLKFSVLGTIEPRKNHRMVLEAFEPLLGQIDGLELAFIGKIGCIDSEFAEKVAAIAADKKSCVRFHSAPSDDAIRNFIEQSRATIYVSAVEGYGLPPVESLWVGTPVIASRTIPSLKPVGSAGVHYVDPLTVLNLRRAVLAFLDDAYANQKAKESTEVELPTWQSFTNDVLQWCSNLS